MAEDESATLEWLVPLERVGEGRRTSAKRVGGKAAALGRLIRRGFPVPRGWVLDVRHFAKAAEAMLPRHYDLASLVKIAATPAGIDRAARARDRLLREPLPDELNRAIEALWRDVEPDAPWGVSVRSSATTEDREDTSLAGIAETVLGARGPQAIADGVRTVWASAFLPRALAYLGATGGRDLGMAVIIQVMVEAKAAGVMFTTPPAGLDGVSWHEDERLINATYGLGSAVVDGATITDTVRMNRHGVVAHATIVEKKSALVVGESGLESVTVDAKKARAPALSDDVLRDLARLADELERGDPEARSKSKEGPFDVEFAVADVRGRERVFVLQARPVTGRGFPAGGDAETVWSRTNVGEALPGAATPLTWSVARAFSDKGFRDAFGALGCNVPKGAVLIGNVHGRFYLNLTSFMRIAAQVPGLTPRALLTASGGATDDVIRTLEAQAADVSKRGFLARLPWTVPRELAKQAHLEEEVEAYEAEASRLHRALVELDLALLPDDALVTTMRSAQRLLERTGGLMLSCASASLASHLALTRLLRRIQKKKAGARSTSVGDEAFEVDEAATTSTSALAQALVGGIRELASAQPGMALARVALTARDEPAALSAIARGEVTSIDHLPFGPTRAALEAFLDEFGERAVKEAELATPRWREDPRPVLAMLAAAVRADVADPDDALARARAISDRELARVETRVNAVELAVLRALIARTQRFTRLRERMRAWVTRVLGMIRRVALDVDRRLRRIEPALQEGCVFFCTFDELLVALGSGRAEIGHVVRLRRAEHARDAARPDPPPTFLGRPPPVILPPAPGTTFVGLPASGGVVEGTARVLEPGAVGLDLVRAGEILISRTTDVGLSPLFLIAAAVVTELGGPLSHAAVVAREYGIPAVVNVTGATRAIKTGDRLRVDGDRGVVDRLDENAPPTRLNSAAPPIA